MKPARFLIPTGYRLATGHAIRSRSFGQLRAPRNLDTTNWEQWRGTLDDQAIFGPLRDFQCACGKYLGQNHQNMICDLCGVKVTSQLVRRQRFGHIELTVPINRPYGENLNSLNAFPVLPAAFRESTSGKDLIQIYDDLVDSNLSKSASGLLKSIDQLLESLFSAFSVAKGWNLQEAEVLAFGMAFESGAILDHDACNHCGYPLEGLKVALCPGCGKLRVRSDA